MKTVIQFFHPDETLVYHIEKTYAKVVFQDNGYFLLLEITSTDDLDHVEEDSIQNDYPQLILSVEDFPIQAKSKSELVDQKIEIPASTVEVIDEDGEMDELIYTNLQVGLNEYELNHNSLSFYKNEDGRICVSWKGEADDFTEETNNGIAFQVNCVLTEEEVLLVP